MGYMVHLKKKRKYIRSEVQMDNLCIHISVNGGVGQNDHVVMYDVMVCFMGLGLRVGLMLIPDSYSKQNKYEEVGKNTDSLVIGPLPKPLKEAGRILIWFHCRRP